MNITIKKFQTMRTLDGGGFSYDLVIDGKTVAFVMDEGCGGCILAQWRDRDAEKKFIEYVAALPPKPLSPNAESWEKELYPDGLIHMDTELFYNDLADRAEMEKKVKRACKTKTVFRLPTDGDVEYRTYNRHFSPQVKAAILAKYPNAIFLNESAS